jgi:integrase
MIAEARGVLKYVIVLLSSWGLRISELAMLEWTDIDFDGR